MNTVMSFQKGNQGDSAMSKSDSVVPQKNEILQSVGDKFQRMAEGLKPQEQQYMQFATGGTPIPMDSSLAQNMMMFKKIQDKRPGDSKFGMRPQVTRNNALKASIAANATGDQEESIGDIFNRVKKDFFNFDKMANTMTKGLKIELDTPFMQETTIEGDVMK